MWTPLSPINYFKYHGIHLSLAEYDWTVVVHNLQRKQKKWVWLSRVLIREGADVRTLGRIYVAVLQAVMIYGL